MPALGADVNGDRTGELQVVVQRLRERLEATKLAHDMALKELESVRMAMDQSQRDSQRFLEAIQAQVPASTWLAVLGAVQQDRSANIKLSDQETAFEGAWVESKEDEWTALMVRRGCGDADAATKVQCCNPVFFKNFTTPLKKLRFASTHPFVGLTLARLVPCMHASDPAYNIGIVHIAFRLPATHS